MPIWEAVLGQFYLAVTVVRLVTLELEDRRSGGRADAAKAQPSPD